MTWHSECPGVDTTHYQGYKITRLEADKETTNKIDERGHKIIVQQYKYVAARPGVPGKYPVSLFKGIDIDRLIARIDQELQLSLF